MAYEKATDLSTDIVHKIGGVNSKTNKPNPTKLEGYYLGSRTVPTADGTSTIHVFQTPKGNEGCWGTADLNSKLGGVTLGTKVLVEYGEKRKLQGGKTKHIYNIYFDKEDTIEVANVAQAGNEGLGDNESFEEGPTDEEETLVDDGRAAALRQEVQDLLRSKGKRQ